VDPHVRVRGHPVLAGHLNSDLHHHLLPRHREGPIVLERRNGLRVLEAERRGVANGERVHVSKLPGDPMALRGIPAVGPNMAGGAILGTRPDQAVLRLDERR
jgi:hypothetical protein